MQNFWAINMRLALLIFTAALMYAEPTTLVPGDPLACFNRMEGAGTLLVVPVDAMPFPSAIDLKTGDVAADANAWTIRARCFNTLAQKQNDVVAASFWMRTISAPNGKGVATFVVEHGASPYPKSVSYTATAGAEWKYVEIPFTMAWTDPAGAYNLSFWVTFPNQEIQIGGFTILDNGPSIPYSQLGLTTWPYEGHEPDAPWRAAAAERIDRYRKGDIVVALKDSAGAPVANAPVHVRMKRHAFGFGTAVNGDLLARDTSDGQQYRDAIKKLFNKTVTENALKWPFFETWGRPQADFMLPWFAANGIQMVRGHNVIWPGMSNLPNDVQNMLKATPVNKDALRARINSHISDVMAYSKGKVTEWDVINEAYTNKDVQAVLGDAEMAAWFQQARDADPTVKLYINDYNILEAGGYDLPHIDGYARIIQNILDAGGPIDGIGLQSHFSSNLTPPTRVLELLDQFAAFGKDLQVTEFDVDAGDEQVQADYTRDFLTMTFSHAAIKGFMIWGFWEGAHWRPAAAMIRKDWTTKPAYDVWNDLLFNQWWTDEQGLTDGDGVYQTRGFLGDYDVEATIDGQTQTTPLTVTQPSTWKLIWSDDFNGPAGAPVDSTKWGFDLGAGGWGNRELERYTNSTDNVFQDGKGNLVIQALKAADNTYTSGRIKTQGKFDVKYGKIEARMKIPFGQGIWPAFWMLGNDIGSAGWPGCGEIDIMENIGKEPATVHGTVHGPGYSGGNGIGGPFSLPDGKRFTDDFHVYAVEWSPESLAFLVDGKKYFEVTPAKLPAGKTWVYQHPFFVILNVAVGGGWPGNPDASTIFPQQMLVDWVRVSQRL